MVKLFEVFSVNVLKSICFYAIVSIEIGRNGDLKPVSSGRDEDLKLIPITE